jgi:hypothetical protein
MIFSTKIWVLHFIAVFLSRWYYPILHTKKLSNMLSVTRPVSSGKGIKPRPLSQASCSFSHSVAIDHESCHLVSLLLSFFFLDSL